MIGSDQSGRQLFLRDVATLQRGDQDPPRRILRYDGQPAIGLGISTVQGGNVVTMGEGVRERLAQLKPLQPLGIEIGDYPAIAAWRERIRALPGWSHPYDILPVAPLPEKF